MLRSVFVLLIIPCSLAAQQQRFQFIQNKMGSPFNIIFYHTDSTEADQLAKECFLLVDSLNSIFSDYSSSSETGRLAGQKTNRPNRVSAEFLQMILQSNTAWKKSGQTFDVTIGSLTQLWRKQRNEKTFPSEKEINEAKRSTGFENLVINEKSGTILLKKPGIKFDFGGIVKGYAAQKVIAYLKSKNISRALADAGGDMAMSEAPPGKNGWSIRMNLPARKMNFGIKN